MVDVSGIDSHEVRDLPIVSVGGVVQSQRGLVIAIMHQYALLGEGKTIHSCGQLEWYKNDVNDKSLKVGGLQRITTNDGYVHPLDIKNASHIALYVHTLMMNGNLYHMLFGHQMMNGIHLFLIIF